MLWGQPSARFLVIRKNIYYLHVKLVMREDRKKKTWSEYVGLCCLLLSTTISDQSDENNLNHTTNVFSNLVLCLGCWLQMARWPISVNFNNYITGDWRHYVVLIIPYGLPLLKLPHTVLLYGAQPMLVLITPVFSADLNTRENRYR